MRLFKKMINGLGPPIGSCGTPLEAPKTLETDPVFGPEVVTYVDSATPT